MQTSSFIEISEAVKASQRVVVIGYPASGKTTLARQIKRFCEHRVFHADFEYQFGAGQSDAALAEVQAESRPLVFEGVLGYRLLRKCVTSEGCEWRPDLVIEVACSEKTRAERYAKERPEKKYASIGPFCKGLDACLSAWKESEESQKARHIVFFTD